MRLSISAKIFGGFLVVLAVFGVAGAFSALSMRRLGDELRVVSRGYLELRLQTADLYTQQGNLVHLLTDQLQRPDGTRAPRWVKLAIDDARRSRLRGQMPAAMVEVRSLQNLRSSPEEQALLHQVQTQLEKIAGRFRDSEQLFDSVYGRISDQSTVLQPLEGDKLRIAAGLLEREKETQRYMGSLSTELRLRAQTASLLLEQSESRAVWWTLAVGVGSLVVGLVVMFLVGLAVRPLRRLAAGARQIAQGDYRLRVEAASNDEIGALGREFNLMAAALEEREQRLIRSERLAAVGKIAAQITHEVRNPLSSIGLNAELLEEVVDALATRLPQNPDAQHTEARALLRAIAKEVDRLTEITEEYLRFARLPRPTLEKESVESLVNDLVSFLRPELERARVEVTVEVPRLPLVAADEHQLRQALLNLLRNAVEAMPGGGRLTLRGSVVPTGIELAITDSGPGIAAEHIAKIFDPFFSTKERGTGLGLALTQQIVIEHGGTIVVDSQPGAGTTFRVQLPIAA
jgi:signal transduction histidine kinase